MADELQNRFDDAAELLRQAEVDYRRAENDLIKARDIFEAAKLEWERRGPYRKLFNTEHHDG